MKKVPVEQLVKKYIGNLQHFIEDGGWPCRVMSDKKAATSHFMSKTEANELIANTGGFMVRKGNCLAKRGKPSNNLLAAYWKKRFEEEREESNRLYSLFTELSKKV